MSARMCRSSRQPRTPMRAEIRKEQRGTISDLLVIRQPSWPGGLLSFHQLLCKLIEDVIGCRELECSYWVSYFRWSPRPETSSGLHCAGSRYMACLTNEARFWGPRLRGILGWLLSQSRKVLV